MSMSITDRTRTVANPDLRAGDKIITLDGLLTLEGDAEPSSSSSAMVCVDVAAGTLHLAAAQSSRVLVKDDVENDDVLDEDYLLSKGFALGDIELFSLGVALGRGREHGVSDAATIGWFCLADVDDRERLMEFTGCTDHEQLKPTADTALAFIQSYRDNS